MKAKIFVCLLSLIIMIPGNLSYASDFSSDVSQDQEETVVFQEDEAGIKETVKSDDETLSSDENKQDASALSNENSVLESENDTTTPPESSEETIPEEQNNIETETKIQEELNSTTDNFVIQNGVLVKYNGNADEVIIPSGVTTIGKYAFEYKNMTKVSIPNTVKTIEEGAFGGCSFLTEITIPSSVKSIGILAFDYCDNLKTVTLSNGLNKISRGAFRGCSSIEKIVIPSTVSTVEAFAFEKCSKLKEVVAMEGVTSLESGVFNGCYCLEKLIVSSSVKDLGYEWSFEDCPNIVIYGKSGSYAETFSKECNIPFKLITAPKAVENLKAISAGKNKVQLTWNASDGAEGYLIYAQKNGTYGYCGMTTKGTSFTDTKALDTDYNFYWVFPYITDVTSGKMLPGGCSKYVYAKGIIPAVKNLKASSVNGGVKLTWTGQTDAEGYLIYGQRANGKYGYIGMTTRGTSFTDTKASKTNYNFYWVYPYHTSNGKMIVGGTPKYTYGRSL